MKKYTLLYVTVLLCGLAALSACTETADPSDEYGDWQHRNEVFFDSIYNVAKARVAAGDESWKVLKAWTKTDQLATNKTDFIVVHVLNAGEGSGSPLYTDSVNVAYRLRTIPTKNAPQGNVLQQTFTGDFSFETAAWTKLYVPSTVTGFATALQYMRIGDYWEVYIPRQLGYGDTANQGIPAFTTLVFNIGLKSYERANASSPYLAKPKD